MRIIIRAVKERAEFIDYLQKHLPSAEWCFDKTKNAMDTFLDAMQMAGNDPVVHMEEDILLTQNFTTKLYNAIRQHPNNVIQFFSMRKADIETGSRWDNNYMMNQCFYLPYGYSKEIYDYRWRWKGIDANPTGTDTMINDFLKEKGQKYWINVPSLVEHRVAKSMIDSRRSSKRQSKTFTEPV